MHSLSVRNPQSVVEVGPSTMGPTCHRRLKQLLRLLLPQQQARIHLQEMLRCTRKTVIAIIHRGLQLVGMISHVVLSGGAMEVDPILVVVEMAPSMAIMGAGATKIELIMSGILIRILVVEVSTCGSRGLDQGVL